MRGLVSVLVILTFICIVKTTSEIVKITSVPEYVFETIPTGQANNQVQAYFEIKKINQYNNPLEEEIQIKCSQDPCLVEVILDKSIKSESLIRWVSENWIKNGILGEIVKNEYLSFRSSIQPLSSLILSEKMVIISDQESWTDENWSLPQYFESIKPFQFGKEKKKMAVYDVTTSCTPLDWHKEAALILKHVACPELIAKNIIFIPYGWRDTLTSDWFPTSLAKSSERSILFFRSSHNTRFFNETIFQLVRGESQGEFENAFRMHSRLRDSAFVICESVKNSCIYDGLMNGAIPFIFKNTENIEQLELIFGEVPFLLGYEHKVQEVLLYYRDHLGELDELQSRVIEYWDSYLISLRRTIHNKLASWFLE